jgi:hypothetical protein
MRATTPDPNPDQAAPPPRHATQVPPDSTAGRPSHDQEAPDAPLRSAAGMVGLGVLMLLCCAGPALVAAGALGALAAWLRNPVLLGAAAGAAAVALAWVAARRWRPAGDSCCAPDSGSDHPGGDPATSQAEARDR